MSDPAFVSGDPFFDARDLVQVKYEMLRRARQDGSTVSDAAAAFGFSRPSFYEAKAAYESGGLPGLLPKRPGPRRAHKLSEASSSDWSRPRRPSPRSSSADLADLARAEFGCARTSAKRRACPRPTPKRPEKARRHERPTRR